MKFLFVFLMTAPLFAQEDINNEIFLFSISSLDSLVIENGINISKNQGYDNQPSFYSSDTLIYTGTRKDQTDIAGYSIINDKKFWLSATKMGSEYSPQRIPQSRDVAAVRLDTTGLQLLYRYRQKTGESRVLLPDLKVGYFFYYNENTLVTAVLSGTGMDLVINDIISGKSRVLIKNIGRSIHKVPQSKYLSYTIANDENNMDLYIMDLEKEEPESFFLCTLPDGVQDYAWLDQNRIILGKETILLVYDMLGKNEWTAVKDLAEYGLKNITRLSVNKEQNSLVFSAEVEIEEK